MRRSTVFALATGSTLIILIAAFCAIISWVLLRADRCTSFLQAGDIAASRNDAAHAESAYNSAIASAVWPYQRALAYGDRARVELSRSQNAEAIRDYTIALHRNYRIKELYAGRGAAWQGNGDYKQALRDYAAALREDPNDGWVYLNRCVIFELRHDEKRALADLNQAIRCLPQSTEALASRGVILAEAQQDDAALADLDIALKLNPSLAMAYRSRSAIFFRRSKFALADADSAAATACDSLDPSKSLAANLASESGDTAHDFAYAARVATNARAYQQAIGLYNIALAAPDLIPYNRVIYRMNRGLDHLSLRELPKALIDFNAAIATQPNYYGAYVNRATVEIELGENERALADSNKALRLKPSSGEAYGVRGEAYSESGEAVAAALADYAKAISILPRYARLYVDRASLLLSTQHPRAALPDIEIVLKLQPEVVDGYTLKGQALDLMGQFDDADQAYRRRLAISWKGDSYYFNQLAWFYATCPDSAVRDAQLALRLAYLACDQSGWREASARDTLAAACAAAGNFTDAINNEQAALPLLRGKSHRAGMEKRLSLYQQHKVYIRGRPE